MLLNEKFLEFKKSNTENFAVFNAISYEKI